MDTADKEYVQRCCDGHPEDFRMLVGRYQGLLVTPGRRMQRRFLPEALKQSHRSAASIYKANCEPCRPIIFL
jgi:hypothetical protein